MRRRYALALVGGSLAWTGSGCGGDPPSGPTPPQPIPTPEPTPTPPQPIPTPEPTPTPVPRPRIAFPLRRSGARFVDSAGAPVRLLGAIGCCMDAGWPLISDQALSDIAAAGGNYAHVRLGPFSGRTSDPPPTPAFWERVEHVLDYAASLGIVVEVDVLDSWILERGHNDSYFGWTCEITHHAPDREQLAWVSQVARYTAAHPNVIYQISNESFDCGAVRAWELGIRDHLRREAPGRLIGTNSHHGGIESSVDYVSRHQHVALAGPLAGRPTQVNETADLTPDGWEREARRAISNGTSFHLWRGAMSDDQWLDALARMARINGVASEA